MVLATTSVHVGKLPQVPPVSQCLCPPGELQTPSASPGDSLRSEGGFAQGSFKLLPLSCILDHVKFCVSPLRVESLVSSVLWVSQK